MKRQAKQDLCNGPILSGMFFYALPIIATGVLQTLYNSADTMVIGQFAGDESLAAVSSTAKVINLLVNLFMGLSTGILTVVARHIGAKHAVNIQKSVHTAIPLALICGTFVLLLGVLIAEPLLRLMGTGAGNHAVFSKAVLYTRIYFLGTPGFLLYNFGASILRAAGDTKRPLIYLTIAGILNVLLNLLLVIVFHLDVAGVAIATIVSHYVTSILVVLRLMREKGDIRFQPARMRIDRRMLGEMLRMGIPSGLQSSMFGIANAVLQSTVNSFGHLYVAGSGAAGQIGNLVLTTLSGYYTTSLAFTSQNFGAHKKRRIRQVLWRGHLLNVLTCAVLCPLLLLFSEPLLRLFTDNTVSLEAGRIEMLIFLSTVVLDGAMQIQVGHLRGLGFSLVPMINSLVGACFLRIAWIWFVLPLFPEAWRWHALYLCYPVTWTTTFLGHIAYTFYARRVLKAFSDAEEIPATTRTSSQKMAQSQQ